MAINKVIYGGETVVDLTADTVSANKMLSGTTAHDKSGQKITGAIPTQAARTITPGTADQTIASGRYLAGAQTIKGDANLVPENIASGVSIFGVEGTLEAGSGGESSDSGAITITNNLDIFMYVGGLLLFPGETGTIPIGPYGNPCIPVSLHYKACDSVMVAVNGYNPNEDWNYSYEETFDVVEDQNYSCGFFINDASGFYDGYTFVISAN